MIFCENIRKTYRMGVNALDGVSLTVASGDFIAVMGPSGSGKTTLMNVLGLLDVPDSGRYDLDGRDITRLSDDDLAKLRSSTIGFVFQQFNLLPRTSAWENVALPLIYSENGSNMKKRAEEMLAKVGLAERIHHKPNELSGGQQQRVAIARALINNPKVILADEPTGNLDSHSQEDIMRLLGELNAQGITLIIITHEEEVAHHARRVIRMRDGKIV